MIMMLVKITISMILFTFLYVCALRIIVSGLTLQERMAIAAGKSPKWLDRCYIALAFFIFCDIIGGLYSIIYLIFFR